MEARLIVEMHADEGLLNRFMGRFATALAEGQDIFSWITNQAQFGILQEYQPCVAIEVVGEALFQRLHLAGLVQGLRNCCPMGTRLSTAAGWQVAGTFP